MCVQYRGDQFNGWQRQIDQPTVQGHIEAALSQVAAHPIRIAAAGRTDAGVHATGQIINFTTSAVRPIDAWLKGVNSLTPKSIQVAWVRQAPANFHPRYAATARRYNYVYYDRDRFNPFVDGLAWCTENLDQDAMHRAAQWFIGEHDFTTFRAAGCQSLSPKRRVNRCEVRRQGHFVVMEIDASAFLLHMVRNIASALCDVGMGAPTRSVRDLLLVKDRVRLGVTAPPQGLYLTHVSYPGADFPPSPEVPLLNAVS
ncbi:MAG: tRNA pseudouridine(38-40) synthase TruA [Gammaproteobacteria bacterium]|nr:tRNA pseudouridine(38-40) synthase TruA [Gammaproteobacteria bacterium]MBT5332912.1 tRNA pseudouridine(38-40) synthase TruA [Gammaproteobacteria bacterium]MBT5682398.1 tRNA pseudouridine(38-40) synthase TruA [Gammaproteobacteria bacterium]